MRKILVMVAVLSMATVVSCFAQEKTKPAAQADKNEPKTIFSYKTEIGLSEKQIGDMKALVEKLQIAINEKSKVIMDSRSELAKMIKNRDNLKLIKAQLEKISASQVELSYYDIETARKIESILTPEQLKKWQNVQQTAIDKLRAEAVKEAKSAKGSAKK